MFGRVTRLDPSDHHPTSGSELPTHTRSTNPPPIHTPLPVRGEEKTGGNRVWFTLTLLPETALSLSLLVYSLYVLKYDLVWGTFAHSHPHLKEEEYSWEPNNILNLVAISASVNLAYTLVSLFIWCCPKTHFFSKKESLLRRCSTTTWSFSQKLLHPFSFLSSAVAGGLLFPLFYMNTGFKIENGTVVEEVVLFREGDVLTFQILTLLLLAYKTVLLYSRLPFKTLH